MRPRPSARTAQWIDMQRSTLNFSDVERMLAACPRVGTPIVRVPDVSQMNLPRASDLGALGVIVPQVQDGIMAMKAGRLSKYPPLGERSCCSGQAPGLWGAFGINYRNTINDNRLTVVMVESPRAVEKAYEIAAQPGVDVVIIGNGDMVSASGYPQTDARYQDLVLKTHDATLKAGTFFGNASNAYAAGTPMSKDSRFHQNGPSTDGFQPPSRGGRGGAGRGGAGRGDAPQ